MEELTVHGLYSMELLSMFWAPCTLFGMYNAETHHDGIAFGRFTMEMAEIFPPMLGTLSGTHSGTRFALSPPLLVDRKFLN